MATTKKTSKKTTKKVEEAPKVEETTKKIEEKVDIKPKTPKKEEKLPKYSIGNVVFIKKEAIADLNGVGLFPQYKNFGYTVEAYDGDTGVYTLRRLKLLLYLPETLIQGPDERGHDVLNRKQF